MTVTRRAFVAGTAAAVAAVAAPPVLAVPTARDFRGLRFAPVRISEEMEQGIGHNAIRRFTVLSCWYFDPDSYPGNPIIRHHKSGLTFMIEEDAEARVYARRILLPTDPTGLTESRYLLTGIAARRVAIRDLPNSRKWTVPRYMLVNDLDMARWRDRVAAA